MLAAFVRAGLVAGGLSTAAMAACSGASPAPAAPPPNVACPANLGEALTASCGSASETCSFLYPCGPFEATATCACDGRRFACTDVANVSIQEDGGGPSCIALTTARTCPLSQSAANQTACSELGQQCAYPSVCKGTPAFDTCECIPDQTGSGAVPHFECYHACVLFPASDASLPNDATPEASIDAPGDAPPNAPSDAAPADAHPEATPTDAPAD